MPPQNLKALLSLITDTSCSIIGFMLCAKLDANSIVALVSFWAQLYISQIVQKCDEESLSTIASLFTIQRPLQSIMCYSPQQAIPQLTLVSQRLHNRPLSKTVRHLIQGAMRYKCLCRCQNDVMKTSAIPWFLLHHFVTSYSGIYTLKTLVCGVLLLHTESL